MATLDDDRVSLGERYGSATASSNLRVGDRCSDADLVIAAGWLDDNLGALLFRLASEYDVAKGGHGIAKVEFDRAETAAAKLEAEAMRTSDPDLRAKQLNTVRTMRFDARAQALTSWAMVLIHLKSLRETKQALHAVAMKAIENAGLDWPERVVASLVGQCLDVHLDPTCHHCQGRGSNGGFGAIRTICRECKGSTRRSSSEIGKDGVQRQFAAWLLSEMRRLLSVAGAGIGRALGSSVRDDSRVEEARVELGEVLAAMRSQQAEAD